MTKQKPTKTGKKRSVELQEQPENKTFEMFSIIEKILNAFSKALPGSGHLHLFFAWIVGLILADDDDGAVSAVMRGLNWSARFLYHQLNRFIHSPKWLLENLKKIWAELVPKIFNIKETKDGSKILLGDHCHMAKDGIKIPGLQKTKSSSSSKSKKELTNCLTYGWLSVLTEELKAIPVYCRRHAGLEKIFASFRKDMDEAVQKLLRQFRKDENESMVENLGNDIRHVTSILGFLKTLVVLDRGFCSVKLLEKIKEIREETGQIVDVLIRCRINTKAYEDAPKTRPKGKRGRNPKYGQEVKFEERFKDNKAFIKTTALIYGKRKKIRYLYKNLNWHDFKLRFILVKFYDDEEKKNREMILATTNLEMDPVEAIELYCYRFRIEQFFRDGKVQGHLNSGRFNSHKAPKYSRNDERLASLYSKITDPTDKKKIMQAVLSMDAYVFFSSLAMSIIYYLCERYANQPEMLDPDFTCVPEEKLKATVTTVQQTLRKNFLSFVFKGPSQSIMRKFFETHVQMKSNKRSKKTVSKNYLNDYVQDTLF